MAKRHSKHMPELANINGTLHKLSVFVVLTRQDGLPRECRLLGMDEKVTIQEGMEFMTAYVPKVMFDKKEAEHG